MGEIVGYGSNCDAFHMTAPDPTGEGAAMAMQLALDEAKLKLIISMLMGRQLKQMLQLKPKRSI